MTNLEAPKPMPVVRHLVEVHTNNGLHLSGDLRWDQATNALDMVHPDGGTTRLNHGAPGQINDTPFLAHIREDGEYRGLTAALQNLGVTGRGYSSFGPAHCGNHGYVMGLNEDLGAGGAASAYFQNGEATDLITTALDDFIDDDEAAENFRSTLSPYLSIVIAEELLALLGQLKDVTDLEAAVETVRARARAHQDLAQSGDLGVESSVALR